MAYRKQFNSNRRDSKPMEIGESSTNNPKSVTHPGGKPPVSRKLFSPKKEIEENKAQKEIANEEDLMTDDFESEGESFFNANCNVVSVLPCEYNQDTEVCVREETDEEEMARHRPVCYYVLNNGAVEDEHDFFEKPDEGMKYHLKPLFIRAKIEQ